MCFFCQKKYLKRLRELVDPSNGKERLVYSTGAKVKWEIIYKPKEGGGVGLKNLGEWNKACLARIVWMLFTVKDTFWIAW